MKIFDIKNIYFQNYLIQNYNNLIIMKSNFLQNINKIFVICIIDI